MYYSLLSLDLPIIIAIAAVAAVVVVAAVIAGVVIAGKKRKNSQPVQSRQLPAEEKQQPEAAAVAEPEVEPEAEAVAEPEVAPVAEVEPEPKAEPVAEEAIPEPVAEEVVPEPEPEQPVISEQTVTVADEEVEEEPESYFPEEIEEEPAEEPDADEADLPQPVHRERIIPDVAPEGKVFIRVRYNRSYTAKLIQGSDMGRGYYNEIKNELLRYGVKDRISWRHETFRSGRKLLARLAIRGKTLCVYLALNPADYADSKYKIRDVSAIARNAEVPLLYRIKNDRRCKYVKELIADVMAAHGLTAGEEQNVDYAANYPYEELESLIDRKLVKLLPWKEIATESEVGVIAVDAKDLPPELLMGEVSVAEAEEMFVSKNVEALVEESSNYSDRTKRDIVNIDTLGKYFEAGEIVTLAEIKKRVPGFNPKTTFVKVLGRGVLDKALTVEADDFSPEAVKMIYLTGGKAIHKKVNKN